MGEKIDFSVYSAAENVKKLKAEAIQPYLKNLDDRLKQLAEVLTREDDGFIAPYIQILRNSIGCLKLKHQLTGKDQIDFTLSIDPTDSGFPTVRDFYLLEKDQQEAAGVLERCPPHAEIIDMIRNRILKGRDPIDPQVVLKKYRYYDALTEARLLKEYHLNAPTYSGDENRRRVYTLQWSCIERGTNVPVFYRMYLEQDEDQPPLERGSDGLLETFIYQSQYGTADLRTTMFTIDYELDGIHPKLAYKYTIGPFFDAGITRNNKELAKLKMNPEEGGVLKFKVEVVASQWIKKVGGMLRRFFGREIDKEIYGPLDDSDTRMIVPFGIKQSLGSCDEKGEPCKIYGVTKEGEIIE